MDGDCLDVTLTSVLATTVQRMDTRTHRIHQVRFDVPIHSPAIGFAAAKLTGARYSVAAEAEPGSIVHVTPSDMRTALDITSDSAARHCFQQLLEAISGIHAVGVPPVGTLPARPPWIIRLTRYLEAEEQRDQDILAQATSNTLRQHLFAVLRRAGDGTKFVIHGAPSLAATYYRDGDVCVLVGADLASARPELDWGYLLGELGELASTGGYPAARYAAASMDVLLSTIRDRGLDVNYVNEVAIAKRFLHLVDYQNTCRMYEMPVPNVEKLQETLAELANLVEWAEHAPTQNR
ncbi:hypothetical protein [Nocardia sp. NPDC050175]|uniref:hypothetical protein n=1 Tax=Nocardia sp. NPDC050175 TaxID=3364317 RepID=UPI0037B19DDE